MSYLVIIIGNNIYDVGMEDWWKGNKGEALFADEWSNIFNRREVVIFELENGQIHFPVGSDFDSTDYRVDVQFFCSYILLTMIAQQSGELLYVVRFFTKPESVFTMLWDFLSCIVLVTYSCKLTDITVAPLYLFFSKWWIYDCLIGLHHGKISRQNERQIIYQNEDKI